MTSRDRSELGGTARPQFGKELIRQDERTAVQSIVQLLWWSSLQPWKSCQTFTMDLFGVLSSAR